jgi:hypothetical protein
MKEIQAKEVIKIQKLLRLESKIRKLKNRVSEKDQKKTQETIKTKKEKE